MMLSMIVLVCVYEWILWTAVVWEMDYWTLQHSELLPLSQQYTLYMWPMRCLFISLGWVGLSGFCLSYITNSLFKFSYFHYFIAIVCYIYACTFMHIRIHVYMYMAVQSTYVVYVYIYTFCWSVYYMYYMLLLIHVSSCSQFTQRTCLSSLPPWLHLSWGYWTKMPVQQWGSPSLISTRSHSKTQHSMLRSASWHASQMTI